MDKIKLPKDHPHKDGRTCTTCGEFKPVNSYTLSSDPRSLGGVSMRSKCKKCDEFRKYKRFVQKTYNISYEDYLTLFESQSGCCAICKSKVSNSRTTRLFVDHCHDTMKVRGLLCSACNHGLGLFKDSPSVLKRAIDYLNADKE